MIDEISASILRRFCLLSLCALSAAGSPVVAAEKPAERPFTHTIYLVRHGAYDQAAKVDPEVGGPLTPLGIAQARLVAARLRGLPVRIDSIASSTMERAGQTAVIVRESLPDVEFRQSSDLSECTPPASRHLDGDSPDEQAACANRLDRVFGERFAAPRTIDRNDLIVAHGNVIRYFVAKALSVDTHAWLGFSVGHASLTVIRVHANGTMSVLAVGDLGHIPPNLQSWGDDSDRQLFAPQTVLARNPSEAPPESINRTVASVPPSESTSTPPAAPIPSPESVEAEQRAAEKRLLEDFAGLHRYAVENTDLRPPMPKEQRVVFMGDSITEAWGRADRGFFARSDFVNRGIGGQTTSQMLVRFRQDVIALKPSTVHILAGTNDIAGNTGPIALTAIEANIASMVDIAEANHVRVVLGSVLPATDFPWRRGLEPGPKIVALNTWLKGYAKRLRMIYVDYYSVLTDGALGMRSEFSPDGVHPSRSGYGVMDKLAEAAIRKAEHLPGR
jgi:broad specificity phosphatase PhoE/lysophospholipase L1-like esterase